MNLKSFPLAPGYRYLNKQKQDQCFRAGDISEADNKGSGKGMDFLKVIQWQMVAMK